MAHIDAGKTTTTERILYLHGPHPQDRRGPRRRRDDGLDGAGAGARHHDHVGRDDGVLARPSHQHHRYARPRGLHGRGGASRCACSTARSRCSTRSPACSRSPRPCGARPTSTRCRASCSSTRWTASARTSSPPCSRCASASARTRCRSRSRSARRTASRGVVDLFEMKAIVYTDDLGQDVRGDRHPGRARRAGAEVPPPADRRRSRTRRRGARAVPRGRELGRPPTCCKRAIRAGTHRRRDHADAAAARAFKNKGVQPLLDAVVDYLPIAARRAADSRASTRRPRPRSTRKASTSRSRSARSRSRSMTDPYVGKLTYFRVYSGVLKAGDHVLQHDAPARRSASAASCGCTPTIARTSTRSAPARSRRRVGLKSTTHRRHACDRERADRARVDHVPGAGDLASPSSRRRRPIRTSSATALARLAEEDPTFRVATDEETGQTIIAGMGELHLEIIVDRLKREFKVDANVGQPQVAYRETITKPAERCRASSSGRPAARASTATSVINLLPQEPGTGYEFVDKIVGGKIPKEYIKPIDEGIREAMRLAACSPATRWSTSRRARSTVVPRRRLEGNGVQDRRLDGVQGGDEAREAEAARADHESRGDDAQGLPRRRHRRPQLAPRPDRAA